ncbi:hypothetical protein FHW84_002202 [Dyella sp. SG562]|uniref:hypothetical protein n=1 Tax=Dyella sp. SG562 TaxID=2587017 RepID=UPI001420B0D2|nr:hypothetical protein [Dyella sp. SG562]NII73630.1 hypothetical protein [Dyella sp. SG562]
MEGAVEVSHGDGNQREQSRQSDRIGEIGVAVRHVIETIRRNTVLVKGAGTAPQERMDNLRRPVGLFHVAGEMADAEA